MGRRFINQLEDRESVNEVYQVSEKKLRPNRNGDLYLQVQLSDRTGAITARLWNASQELYTSFEDGDFLKVEGRAQLYQGEMQIIATRLKTIDGEHIKHADFVPQADQDMDQLIQKFQSLLRSIENPPLRNLVDCFLMDEEFMAKFTKAPAGVKNHHAYWGGLLEHVFTIMQMVDRIKPLYPQLDRDLLLMGAFLHDLGKIDELSYLCGFGYTDHGQLVGHIVIAIGILQKQVDKAEQLSGEPFPPELLLQLQHLIVSHHGQYEFGSPKLPMTLEAVALCQLDNLDAKLHSFHQLMKEDPNTDSPWTLYHPSIDRKLYKGGSTAPAESLEEPTS
ncbi:Metal dependent phosphohydrolase [Planctomycetales bacterium 10988]|nr:Metal dependent phosphohydrolase [Planctomycetales bacterium 10988]